MSILVTNHSWKIHLKNSSRRTITCIYYCLTIASQAFAYDIAAESSCRTCKETQQSFASDTVKYTVSYISWGEVRDQQGGLLVTQFTDSVLATSVF